MKPFMGNVKERKILSEVALGNIPPDTVIVNGTPFNAFTGEFITKQSIWIKDGRIAYVGPDHGFLRGEQTGILDADGMVLLPGLIEGHTHLSKAGIEEYTRHVIPTGVTTVVMETMDFGLISGKEGIECLVKGLEGQPIRFYYTVPALCGLTPEEEINAPPNEEFLTLLKNPRCLGVGEIFWGNMFLDGKQGERVRELASLALSLGKQVEGHTAGASGRKLQAYTSFGASSDHEPITEDEVLERLRLGYWVMVRQGFVRKELPAVVGIFNRKVDFRRLSLATDGVDPQTFMEEGYLDASLKTLLRLGAPPELAYQMVTLNVAEHFRLDHLIGSLSPGKIADIVVVPSRETFSPQYVMCEGRVIFKDGKNIIEPRKVTFPEPMFDTVKVSDVSFPSIPRQGKVRVMELVTNLITKERVVDLKNPEESKDVLMLLALDRVGGQGSFMGALKGFGLQRGAYGTTMSWDTVDMVVAGCDVPSIKTVIGRLKQIRGGGVYAIGNEIVSEIQAPLCGFYSLEPMEELHRKIKHLEESLRKNGVKWEKPVLTIDTLGTPAIPHLKISHHGYVRLKDREILSLEI
jgi:adenine deaminase